MRVAAKKLPTYWSALEKRYASRKAREEEEEAGRCVHERSRRACKEEEKHRGGRRTTRTAKSPSVTQSTGRRVLQERQQAKMEVLQKGLEELENKKMIAGLARKEKEIQSMQKKYDEK